MTLVLHHNAAQSLISADILMERDDDSISSIFANLPADMIFEIIKCLPHDTRIAINKWMYQYETSHDSNWKWLDICEYRTNFEDATANVKAPAMYTTGWTYRDKGLTSRYPGQKFTCIQPLDRRVVIGEMVFGLFHGLCYTYFFSHLPYEDGFLVTVSEVRYLYGKLQDTTRVAHDNKSITDFISSDDFAKIFIGLDFEFAYNILEGLNWNGPDHVYRETMSYTIGYEHTRPGDKFSSFYREEDEGFFYETNAKYYGIYHSPIIDGELYPSYKEVGIEDCLCLEYHYHGFTHSSNGKHNMSISYDEYENAMRFKLAYFHMGLRHRIDGPAYLAGKCLEYHFDIVDPTHEDIEFLVYGLYHVTDAAMEDYIQNGYKLLDKPCYYQYGLHETHDMNEDYFTHPISLYRPDEVMTKGFNNKKSISLFNKVLERVFGTPNPIVCEHGYSTLEVRKGLLESNGDSNIIFWLLEKKLANEYKIEFTMSYGVIHNEDDPSIKIYEFDGFSDTLVLCAEFFVKYGVIHRDGDEPAIILHDIETLEISDRYFVKHGSIHRNVGPAIIHEDVVFYYKNNICCPGDVVIIDDTVIKNIVFTPRPMIVSHSLNAIHTLSTKQKAVECDDFFEYRQHNQLCLPDIPSPDNWSRKINGWLQRWTLGRIGYNRFDENDCIRSSATLFNPETNEFMIGFWSYCSDTSISFRLKGKQFLKLFIPSDTLKTRNLKGGYFVPHNPYGPACMTLVDVDSFDKPTYQIAYYINGKLHRSDGPAVISVSDISIDVDQPFTQLKIGGRKYLEAYYLCSAETIIDIDQEASFYNYIGDIPYNLDVLSISMMEKQFVRLQRCKIMSVKQGMFYVKLDYELQNVEIKIYYSAAGIHREPLDGPAIHVSFSSMDYEDLTFYVVRNNLILDYVPGKHDNYLDIFGSTRSLKLDPSFLESILGVTMIRLFGYDIQGQLDDEKKFSEMVFNPIYDVYVPKHL